MVDRLLSVEDTKQFFGLHEMLKLKLNARPASDSFAEFVRCAWHIVEPNNPFVPGWHIDAICEHMEAVFKGQIRDLLINIPPRHMKSTAIPVMFPAWAWIKKPEMKFLCGAYAQGLSTRDSMKCRNIIESNWYRDTFDIPWYLSSDQNAKQRYKNTMQGERISTSVGGSGTGEGCDVLIFDDPHNALEASSEAARRQVINYWDQVMSSRGNDPKKFARVVIMQRLHENDLSGHILASGGYEHLCLPAEYDGRKSATSIGWTDPRKNLGDLLWPERFGKVEVEKLKKDLGSQGAAGQLQQLPGPAEGHIVKDNWWRFYSVLPDGITKWISSWDLTFSETERGSFVVGQIWGCKNADRYLVHQWRERVGFNGQLDAFRNLDASYPQVGRKLVEKKANGAALIDVLQSKISGIIPVEPRGSKIARAESVAPQIESGNVYLPEKSICPWVDDYLHEWRVFPNGANDDQVDATSQALSYLRGSMNMVNVMPVSMTAPSKWIR
jgi:predicted phage terminase large subunit-like protein